MGSFSVYFRLSSWFFFLSRPEFASSGCCFGLFSRFSIIFMPYFFIFVLQLFQVLMEKKRFWHAWSVLSWFFAVVCWISLSLFRENCGILSPFFGGGFCGGRLHFLVLFLSCLQSQSFLKSIFFCLALTYPPWMAFLPSEQILAMLCFPLCSFQWYQQAFSFNSSEQAVRSGGRTTA